MPAAEPLGVDAEGCTAPAPLLQASLTFGTRGPATKRACRARRRVHEGVLAFPALVGSKPTWKTSRAKGAAALGATEGAGSVETEGPDVSIHSHKVLLPLADL